MPVATPNAHSSRSNKIKLKQYQVNLASLDLGKSMIPLKM
jgi:hypothetical protein